jgi:hypothetical protein
MPPAAASSWGPVVIGWCKFALNLPASRLNIHPSCAALAEFCIGV